MPYISRQQLIEGMPNISPETVLMINNFYSTFDNRSAANRQITNVEPLFYQGAVAGSEFLTYAATKLYLCLSITAGSDGITAFEPQLYFYDFANALTSRFRNTSTVFDAVAAINEFQGNVFTLKNIYFSRLTAVSYITFSLIGYRITLT